MTPARSLRFKLPALACILLAVLSFAPRTARAGVTFSFFYDSLSPHGYWASIPDYGYCWHPEGVSEGWRPYTDGYWAYTDAGWTWVSYEDWGGITYHYGRWTLVDGYGWVWVPGYNWGPAWVSWRRNDDYVGWAPLPPECRFHEGITIGFSVDTAYGIGPGWYNFCAFHDFGSPSLGPVLLDPGRNVAIIGSTVNITNITYAGGAVHNGGPSFGFVAQRTARPIQRLSLVRTGSPARLGAGFQSVSGGSLRVVAPTIDPSPGAKPAVVAHTFSKSAVNHGWSGVPAATRQALHTQFSHERGPQSLATISKSSTLRVSKPVTPAVAVSNKSSTSDTLLHPFKSTSEHRADTVGATETHTEKVRKPVTPETEDLETHHRTVKTTTEASADHPMQLRKPPSPPKVSTAGGPPPRKEEKKEDKKKDDEQDH